MPITVGALSNVPAPGDPVASPWAQQASGYVVHPFATAAALVAQWPTAPNGSQAVALDTFTRYVKTAAGGAGWVTAGCDGASAFGGAAGTIVDGGDLTLFANINVVSRPWARVGLVVVQGLAAMNAGQGHLRLRKTADNAVDALAVITGTGIGTVTFPFALAANTNASWYAQWRGAGGGGSCFVDPTTNKWATYAWPV